MMRRSESPEAAASLLRAEGVFVVHLRANSDPEQRLVNGRIEHVKSGQSEAFVSLAGLLDFMARSLPPPTLPREEE